MSLENLEKLKNNVAKEHSKNTGICLHPVRLSDGTRRRCWSRNPKVCPGCARIYKQQQFLIMSNGFQTEADFEKGNEIFAEGNFFFLTFTAPSFGKVHTGNKEGTLVCSCGKLHEPKDTILGAAIDPKFYDYKGQVLWNHASGNLWRTTQHEIMTKIPGAELAVVREWQKRGVIHFHAIIRVPEKFDSLKARAILEKSNSVISKGFSWGGQIKVDPINLTTKDQTISYATKVVAYSTKTVGNEDVQKVPGRAKHISLLDEAAKEIVCKAKGCAGDGTCKGKAHKRFGYSGYMFSQTDGWSLDGLNRRVLNERAKAWAEEARLADPHEFEAKSEAEFLQAKKLEDLNSKHEVRKLIDSESQTVSSDYYAQSKAWLDEILQRK